MMPVNLFVIRHGQSIGNLAKRKSEDGDTSLIKLLKGTHTAHWPLTKKGVEQAKKAGAFLQTLISQAQMWPDRMYVSSYARAMQTAANLDLIRANWIIDSRITERDWGDLDCLTDEEREEQFSHAILMRTIEPFFFAPPNGESFKDLIIRIRDFIDSLHRADVQNVVVVCHGEVMKALRIILCQMTPSEYAEMEFSKDPLKRIHNCQIDHYCKRDPVSLSLSDRLDYLRVYRPAEGCDFATDWCEIPRRRFSNFELMGMAGKLASPFSLFVE